jgi:hypothetical protein
VSKIISGKSKHVFTGGFNDKGCTSVNGTHEGKFEKLASFTAPEEAQLKALLKYVNVQASGVAGKPTVQFSGANVQVVNGAGRTASTNGEGNLVIGYDENTGVERGIAFNKGTPLAGKQTGSHNLILGYEQEFTSYSGLVAGYTNTTTAPFGSVTGGGNTASNNFASVSGGVFNTASGVEASVSGGGENTASAQDASISGGRLGTASGAYTSVSGGKSNTANVSEASISGGEGNKASTLLAWIGGGFKNEVVSNGKPGEEGRFASIFGGKENKTAKDYEVIP